MPALAQAVLETYLSEDSAVTEFLIRHPWIGDEATRIEDAANRIIGERRELNARDEQLAEKWRDSVQREARLRLDYEKMGFPVHHDPKTGTKVDVDWQAPFRNERAAWRAERERGENKAKLIPKHSRDEMKEWLRSNSENTFRQVERPTLDGDAFELISEKETAFNAILAEVKAVQDANATDAEVIKRVEDEYHRRCRRGEIFYYGILRNGTQNSFGKFDPTLHTGYIEYFEAPHGAGTVQFNIEAAFDIVLSLDMDSDQRLFKAMVKQALRANADKPKMSVDDKITRLNELAKLKLVAARDLEAAYRYAEDKGARVKRFRLPIEVLLWAELDTNAPRPARVLDFG